MKPRDHAAASVAALRAELADLRPRPEAAGRERDDERTKVEILGAMCDMLKARNERIRAAWTVDVATMISMDVDEDTARARAEAAVAKAIGAWDAEGVNP